MNTYQLVENSGTPQYNAISNVFTKTNDKSKCNPFNSTNNFGNYFQQCTKESESAYWGSNKPTPDNCLKPQEGIPCNSLWNNSTKRKTMVEYKR